MMLQASAVSESLQPLPPAEHMFLVFDGACSKHGLRSWYELGLDVCPLMVLKDGVYDGVSALGPMIADLRASSVLKTLWEDNHPIMRRAAVYHTSYDEMGLLDFLRARVQVIMPGELLAWLRLGDARVVSRLAEADGHFPPQFWSGVDSIFFQSETALITSYQPTRASKGNASDERALFSQKVVPHFHFGSDLLSALDSSNDLKHREVL